MRNDFEAWFKKITGYLPFPYQTELATAPVLPAMIRVPTGAGKTAAIIGAWLWRQMGSGDASLRAQTPRRLVYCLPMRVLVEQTIQVATQWLRNAGLDPDETLFQLMGGEVSQDYVLRPEAPALLIGTQDMLLSRALNRGYAASRYRWPIEFGLLHNDCLWVLDEVQLMDTGLATSCQLDGFRQRFKTQGPAHSIWMSATLDEAWLHTVDLDATRLGSPLELTPSDTAAGPLQQRYHAKKRLQKAQSAGNDEKALAKEIFEAHQLHTGSAPIRILVVVNTVDRAVNVYKALQKLVKTGPELLLLHSRYRPEDRLRTVRALGNPLPLGGQIVVSTQVIEAGVDLSSKVLFTDLAPWASLVQRFGRCNRAGEYNGAEEGSIIWIDALKNPLPYEKDELETAKLLLERTADVGPASLAQLQAQYPKEYKQAMWLEPTHVLRRKDLLDLFDTTPDLAGQDLDISRFIRSGEDFDVQVFWRDWPESQELTSEADYGKAPQREELCPVPVGPFRKFAGERSVYRWDALKEEWAEAKPYSIYPGQTFLVRCGDGGYDAEVGWNPKSGAVVPVTVVPIGNPAYGGDMESSCPWLTIQAHTDRVVQAAEAIAAHFGLDEKCTQALLVAARWHDRGKAHPVFQSAIQNKPEYLQASLDIAKAPNAHWRHYERKHFRHELASALAMLHEGLPDLAVYLAAAHHGKVRLSIRSLPGEFPPEDEQKLYARGIHDGDRLPQTPLGDGTIAPEVLLSLACMQLGRSATGEPSWVERMLRLREEWGPFRLAFFESLFRMADWRASKED